MLMVSERKKERAVKASIAALFLLLRVSVNRQGRVRNLSSIHFLPTAVARVTFISDAPRISMQEVATADIARGQAQVV
jgi:hypothetical protein